MSNAQAQYTFIHACTSPDPLSSEYPSDKQVEYRVSFGDDVRWIEVADEFFNFLSSIYGYRCDPNKYAKSKK